MSTNPSPPSTLTTRPAQHLHMATSAAIDLLRIATSQDHNAPPFLRLIDHVELASVVLLEVSWGRVFQQAGAEHVPTGLAMWMAVSGRSTAVRFGADIHLLSIDDVCYRIFSLIEKASTMLSKSTPSDPSIETCGKAVASWCTSLATNVRSALHRTSPHADIYVTRSDRTPTCQSHPASLKQPQTSGSTRRSTLEHSLDHQTDVTWASGLAQTTASRITRTRERHQ
jgi:hypothetical protein